MTQGMHGEPGVIAPGTVVRAPVEGPLNIARACLEARASDPAFADEPAFSFLYGDRTERWTYAEAWERVERIGRGLLARGLAPDGTLRPLVHLFVDNTSARALRGLATPTPVYRAIEKRDVAAATGTGNRKLKTSSGTRTRPPPTPKKLDRKPKRTL